jgi:hypothetical protein
MIWALLRRYSAENRLELLRTFDIECVAQSTSRLIAQLQLPVCKHEIREDHRWLATVQANFRASFTIDPP